MLTACGAPARTVDQADGWSEATQVHALAYEWFMRAEILSHRGQWKRAKGAYERAQKRDPRSSQVLLGLARALTHLGEVRDAESILVRVHRAMPRSSQLWLQIARLQRKRGRPAQAYLALERAAVLEPARFATVANRELAELLELHGAPQRAKRVHRRLGRARRAPKKRQRDPRKRPADPCEGRAPGATDPAGFAAAPHSPRERLKIARRARCAELPSVEAWWLSTIAPRARHGRAAMERLGHILYLRGLPRLAEELRFHESQERAGKSIGHEQEPVIKTDDSLPVPAGTAPQP